MHQMDASARVAPCARFYHIQRDGHWQWHIRSRRHRGQSCDTFFGSAVLHVVGNRDWALGCGIPFVEKLARCTLPGQSGAERRQENPYQSPWEERLDDALRQAGIHTVPQYSIAGRFLDLAILNPKKVDVEVDGETVHRTAGGGRKDDDYWRDLQLQSLGWKVCRFWVYELREDLTRCTQKVLSILTCECCALHTVRSAILRHFRLSEKIQYDVGFIMPLRLIRPEALAPGNP
jgi:very-short-patch-repair endonuclease